MRVVEYAAGHEPIEPDMWARSLIVESIALQLMIGHTGLCKEHAQGHARAVVRLAGSPTKVRLALLRAADALARGHYAEPYHKLPYEGQAHVRKLAAEALSTFFAQLGDVVIPEVEAAK